MLEWTRPSGQGQGQTKLWRDDSGWLILFLFRHEILLLHIIFNYYRTVLSVFSHYGLMYACMHSYIYMLRLCIVPVSLSCKTIRQSLQGVLVPIGSIFKNILSQKKEISGHVAILYCITLSHAKLQLFQSFSGWSKRFVFVNSHPLPLLPSHQHNNTDWLANKKTCFCWCWLSNEGLGGVGVIQGYVEGKRFRGDKSRVGARVREGTNQPNEKKTQTHKTSVELLSGVYLKVYSLKM